MDLLLLTAAAQPTTEVLPALGLLTHRVRVLAPHPRAARNDPGCPADAVLVDARHDLVAARDLTRKLANSGLDVPLLVVLTEGGLTAARADWRFDEFLLDRAGPAEVEARLRLAAQRRTGTGAPGSANVIRSGDLTIDESTYSVRLRGAPLDLTFREFELLKYLARNPGQVFSRQRLLSEVWGYDFIGGTRTVDVHVRRLRAKLGREYDSLIGTVRGVGYRFARPPKAQRDPVLA